jgi:glutamate dehydrogenase/leucine dehydrogenase
VAGGASNQIANDSAALLLAERKILYAPDFVVNSGGFVYAWDTQNTSPGEHAKVAQIYDHLKLAFSLAKRLCVPTHQAVRLLVQESEQSKDHADCPTESPA